MTRLRRDQKRDVRNIFAAWKKHRRVLYVLPTGAGKTVVGAHVVQDFLKRGKRVLFLAHRKELIDQAVDRLQEYGIDPDLVGVILAGRTEDGRRPVQVAGVQTLINRAIPVADLIVVDEAHHAAAQTYQRILKASPRAKVLGLTATPWRYSGDPLSAVFDDLLEGDNMMTLIAAGVLAKPRVFSVPESELPVLTAVKKVMGDFEVKSLSQAVRQGVVIGKLVDHWFQRAANRPTIAFTVDVRHSKILAKRFRQRGVTCEHIDGTTPPEERAAILHRLATGKTKIVTNCMILCEGLDLASVKCVILARPTTSLTLYLQQCGRILRPHHRHDPMILDHSGNVVVMKHGLPHDEREVSLFTKTTPEKDHVDGGPSKVTCLSCGLVYSSSELECSNCGQENPRVRKQKEADIELVEMEKAMKAEKDALYKRALKEAKAQGAKRPEAFARVVVEANYA